MYVRKTMTLVDDIVDVVDVMKRKALTQLKTDTEIAIDTPLHAEMKTAIENSLWQKAPDIKDKMPDAWCGHDDYVQATFGTDKRHYFNAKQGDLIKVPPKHSRYDTVDVPEKFWTPLIKEWLQDSQKATETQDSIVDEYTNISNQLVRFMGKHASLNTALKEMPELELYVPSEYMQRVNKKEVRGKPTPTKPTTCDDVEVDVDALTKAAIAHRVTGGN